MCSCWFSCRFCWTKGEFRKWSNPVCRFCDSALASTLWFHWFRIIMKSTFGWRHPNPNKGTMATYVARCEGFFAISTEHLVFPELTNSKGSTSLGRCMPHACSSKAVRFEKIWKMPTGIIFKNAGTYPTQKTSCDISKSMRCSNQSLRLDQVYRST